MAKLKYWFILPILAVCLASCSGQKETDAVIKILDAKTAGGVDDKYMPVDAASVFADGTSKVFCWFLWKDSRKDIKILAKWHYITDDIPVMNYTFIIPRREGSGGVSLTMPEGKALPSGLYRVTLESDNKQLKSLVFKVLEKK